MVTDLLLEDLSTTVCRQAERFKPFKNDVLFTGSEFYNYILARRLRYTGCWVLTYTAREDHPLVIPVDRLVCAVGSAKAKEQRNLLNIHSKMFLFFVGGRLREVFTGSQNLVKPTQENIMVRLDPINFQDCKDYFLHYWKQAKP